MNNKIISFRQMPPRKRIMTRYNNYSNPYPVDVGGLGKSFFSKIFSSPKQLKKRIQPKVKRMIPTPKKIKARMKVGLKLMKVALKPSGAKMLARKGGLKTALTKPEQFLQQHRAKKAEMARKRAESEQAAAPAETPQEQIAYKLIDEAVAADNTAYSNPIRENIQRAIDTALAAAAAIRSAGLGEEAAVSWEEAAKMYQDYLIELDRMEETPPESPIEEPLPPTPLPDYNIPSEPPPMYPEEYYQDDYYYPEEYYTSDEYYYPQYEEENLYANYDQGKEIIPGTEWYHELEDPLIGKPPSWEYEASRSDSITPTADWYREYDSLPYDWDYSNEEYYPDYQGMQYDQQYYDQQDDYEYSDYMYGQDHQLSGLKKKGIKMYIPMIPKPINPSFTRLTKTYKYEPDYISRVPFPVSRNIKLRYKGEKPLPFGLWSTYGKSKRNF